MKLRSFLERLRDRDIQVWAEGDRLRCSAPVGALTPELRGELQQRKQDILEFLRSAGMLARQPRAIVPLQPRGTQTPVFAVAGHNGDVFCYRALARHLGDDQPFYGLQPPGLDGHSEPLARVEALAAYFAAQIREFRPDEPYIIAGFCAGGSIAWELGRRLRQEGAAIDLLALFGAPYSTVYWRLPQLRRRLVDRVARLIRHARALASLSSAGRQSYIGERLRNREAERAAERLAAPDPVLVLRAKVERATMAALRRYKPGHFAGRLSLFLPCQEWARSGYGALRWRAVAAHAREYFGPEGCNADNMLREPNAPVFAQLFRRCLATHASCPVAGETQTPASDQRRAVREPVETRHALGTQASSPHP